MPVTPQEKRHAEHQLEALRELPEKLPPLLEEENRLQLEIKSLQKKLSSVQQQLSSIQKNISDSPKTIKKYERVIEKYNREREETISTIKKNDYTNRCLQYLLDKIEENKGQKCTDPECLNSPCTSDCIGQLEDIDEDELSDDHYDLNMMVHLFREWLVSNYKSDLTLGFIITHTDHSIDAIIGLAHLEHKNNFLQSTQLQFENHHRTYLHDSDDQEGTIITYDIVKFVSEELRENVNMPPDWWKKVNNNENVMIEYHARFTFTQDSHFVNEDDLYDEELLKYQNNFGFSLNSNLNNIHWYIHEISYEEYSENDRMVIDIDRHDDFGLDESSYY